MGSGRLSGSDSRRLATLFVAVVAPPALTLVWLGLQLIEQDRSLWAQRDLERRQAAAQLLVRSLEHSLAEAAHSLDASVLPQGVARFTLSSEGVVVEPDFAAPWLPAVPSLGPSEGSRFAAAEKLEYQSSPGRALPHYEPLTRSPNPAIRAAALVRAARVHRRASRWDEALAAYRSLGQIDAVAIEGMPASFVARRAACSVLEEAGRTKELRAEASAFEAELLAGRWALDQPAWELASAQIEQWTGRPPLLPPESAALAESAAWLWREWRVNRAAWLSRPDRTLLQGPNTLICRAEDEKLTALAIPLPIVQGWTAAASGGQPVTLLSDSGRLLAGPKPLSSTSVVKLSPSETGLPWTVVLHPGDPSRQMQEFAGRRRLLSAGLGAIVLLLGGGSYVLWRVIQRELAVARLQTEFVAAVSHEFRTPLTSLRHVTELLEEDDEMPREQRRSFYQALGRNTERLHRLVEALLDFARMESRRKPYRLQPVNVGELAARVVEDFRHEAAPLGFTVEIDVESPGSLEVRADPDALTNALWNLLDNAVKYSPDARTIRVTVHGHPAGVAISVRDRGLGIPRREQKEVFRRFVRGKKAARLGIKGTGLGLAMVSHIIDAHGGTVELESEEGVGSTFRLVLPPLRA